MPYDEATSGILMTTTTYSHLREHFAKVWDEVGSSQEPVILRRRGHEDLALIPAAELRRLQETAHLFQSLALPLSDVVHIHSVTRHS